MEERQTQRRWPLRRSRRADLTAIAVILALVLAGLSVGYSAVYTALYSPGAFVKNYLSMISTGHAADALLLPGVAVDGATLEQAGIAPTASDALLRGSVLEPLTALTITDVADKNGVHEVTAGYTIAGHTASSTFAVVQEGWNGVVPRWRFAQTPLSALELSVAGSAQFSVNGFELDKRQVSDDGAATDLTQPVTLLTFTPGLYRVTVDTQMATSPGTAVLADVPLKQVPVAVSPAATPEFTAVVQNSVNQFLTQCAQQQVLQPTGCPFGYSVRGRVASDPTWAIVEEPAIGVKLAGENWTFPSVPGKARLDVDVQSLYDGTIERLSEDVHFVIAGRIAILADGRASIRIDGIDTE